MGKARAGESESESSRPPGQQWASAAKTLACDEKTRRQDAGQPEVDAVRLVPAGTGVAASKKETGTKRAPNGHQNKGRPKAPFVHKP